ncbi:MAG: type II toxin-antitoxin system RelE/ParE family toxin [Thermomicrobiales bacterium]
MAWDIEITDQFEEWYLSLDEAERASVTAAVGELELAGPSLSRPWADTIKGSRHAGMKELRPIQGGLRVFFAFDPRRTAILLIGGDKSGKWQRWYDRMIPIADDLFDEYLHEIRNEGLIP